MLRNQLRSSENGTKLQKRCERVTKRLQNKLTRYEKDMKLRKRYKATKGYERVKKVRSYEKGTKLRKRYEATKKVRKGYEEVTKLVTKLRKRYEVTKRYEATKKVRRVYEISYERSWLRSYQVTR
jgi:hypothetical protein